MGYRRAAARFCRLHAYAKIYVMKWSIGVDVVSIGRIEQLASRHAERFFKHVYTPAEVEYCLKKKKTSSLHFAARFAAKEALVKAIGTGFRDGIGFREIETIHDPLGKPMLVLYGKALEHARLQGFSCFELSITHDPLVAIAVVLACS